MVRRYSGAELQPEDFAVLEHLLAAVAKIKMLDWPQGAKVGTCCSVETLVGEASSAISDANAVALMLLLWQF